MENISAALKTKGKKVLAVNLGNHLSEKEIADLHTYALEAAVKKARDRDVIGNGHGYHESEYEHLIKTLCTHLNPDKYIKNTYLLKALRAGQVNLQDIPYMTAIELNPDAWNKQIQSRQAETRHVTEGPVTAVTTLITCGKCGSGVKYTEEQTRSADEAMTIKAECVKCGNRFNI